jgi:glycosyltransferase involved in cell wall biosynthesis
MQTISQVVVANLGLGIPHVATSHDMVRPECFPGISGRMKLAVLNGIVSQLDTLITVSHAARINHIESLPWLRRLNRPVVPIVNGIDARRFDPAEIAVDLPFRSRLGIPDDVFLAGFLGRFMELKGFMVLVDAMEILAREDRIPPIHVVAVGSGDYVREYRRDVERRPNVRDRITFLPHVADVAPTLQQLDLLVMPSLREACGILAMEAMAVGTPVLGTSCAGLAEVLRDTPSRVVPPSDANALARAIRDEMASPSKQQAREYAVLARQRFDVRHVAAALRHIFDQFSGQSSTTALSKASSHALSPQVDPYA